MGNMNIKLVITIICILMAMGIPVFAQTVAPSPSANESHAGHDTAKSSQPQVAIAPPAHDHGGGKDTQIDEHMRKMRMQMEKIRVATDPLERQRLMQEHMMSMRDGMKMMKSMPGCPMMAGGMKYGESCKMEMGKMMCPRTMHKKMEMMQIMMEGLIETSQLHK